MVRCICFAQVEAYEEPLLHQVTLRNGVVPTSVCLNQTNTDQLLAGDVSGAVSLIDVETGTVISTMASGAASDSVSADGQGDARVMSVVSHPTLPLAISGHADKCVRSFDVRQGKCTKTIAAHHGVVTSVSVDASGVFIATASHDQRIRTWDISTSKIIQSIDSHMTHRKKGDEAVHCVAFHPLLPILSSAGADGIVRIYL
eukprot:TRINITY_DN8509_c0_g1_i2.p1 TRINITY_DN8509_c0_g1~~TRINITY_DN8509_c0_g1_i2.p1  ORF type:complete len:201 (+),score=81.87 TRINITY_DN8509_c0_g1_i2:37-639(+)